MMFRTHLAISLIIAMTILPKFSLDRPILLFFFLLGAFLPDIDSAASFIGKRLKIVGWLFSHRGIFHSLLMLIPLTLMIAVFNFLAGVAFAIGYGSHLLIDMLNLSGVRLFYPLKFRIRGFIKTDGLGEKVIFVCALVIAIILVMK